MQKGFLLTHTFILHVTHFLKAVTQTAESHNKSAKPQAHSQLFACGVLNFVFLCHKTRFSEILHQ